MVKIGGVSKKKNYVGSSSSSSSHSGNTKRNYASDTLTRANAAAASSYRPPTALESANAYLNNQSRGITPSQSVVSNTPVISTPTRNIQNEQPTQPQRFDTIATLTAGYNQANPDTPINIVQAPTTPTQQTQPSQQQNNQMVSFADANRQPTNAPIAGSVGVTYNKGGNITPNSASAPSSGQPSFGQQIMNGITGQSFNQQFPNAQKNTIADTVGMVTLGGLGLFSGLKNAIFGVTKKSAVQTSMKVGLKPLDIVVSKAYSTAGNIPTNTATTAKTISWLGKVGQQLQKPPVIAGMIATGIVGAIGSYPFAGFIKEEALQTLGFTSSTARANKDLAGYQASLEMRREILNPDVWSQIKQSVPFVNVLNNIDDFYKSAKLNLAVDEKLFNDMSIQQQTGETDSQMWQRINNEKAINEKIQIDYYNQERMKLLEWERQAEIEARNEDARFWAREREKQYQREAEEREANAKFWEAYKKAAYKSEEDSRPSKLNFGII